MKCWCSSKCRIIQTFKAQKMQESPRQKWPESCLKLLLKMSSCQSTCEGVTAAHVSKTLTWTEETRLINTRFDIPLGLNAFVCQSCQNHRQFTLCTAFTPFRLIILVCFSQEMGRETTGRNMRGFRSQQTEWTDSQMFMISTWKKDHLKNSIISLTLYLDSVRKPSCRLMSLSPKPPDSFNKTVILPGRARGPPAHQRPDGQRWAGSSGGFKDSIDEIMAAVSHLKGLSDGKAKQWKHCTQLNIYICAVYTSTAVRPVPVSKLIRVL